MEQGKRDAYEVLNIRDDADPVVIRAAFRALAALHHPDSNADGRATRRMAELNDAYAQLRTPELRQAYDRLLLSAGEGPSVAKPMTVPPQSPAAQTSRERFTRRGEAAPVGSSILDFGRYVGWSLADLARHDPDYLRWLVRHSSGIRYRQEIVQLLPEPKREERSNVSSKGRR